MRQFGEGYVLGAGEVTRPLGLAALGFGLASHVADSSWITFASGVRVRSGPTTVGFRGPSAAYLWVEDPKVKRPSLYPSSDEAYKIASQYHPAWSRLPRGAQAMHARNVHQVLGPDCRTPVEFVACWTPGARVAGGTAQAMRIAAANAIEIVNLATYSPLMWSAAINRIMEIVVARVATAPRSVAPCAA